ncbi:MAG TPA: aminoglycoside phosphotransferase family protein [Mesorhizobium sp.]|jgi:aminoglycoside phosphotransferase (APT) family kinase protein|uniref:aminoglycoside phosphotransferase family protein n=1 Tax=Mesorhizobium sp. TaxID=1871066 RepID=UPI002DDD9F90|nr:aminoglycoside phosphotransferase family protein [Mesorhizobium sp.]HEV2504310.1 aminoglycoside phosphotransferase family protein [Mesorhizobium sp.]
MSDTSEITVEIDATLVRRLIDTQFPQWAHLPIRKVEPGGWDNRTFLLGEAMSVRLPSAAGYAAQVAREQHWLPRLAPHLPLPIPAPLALGEPDEGYPWPWSVYGWLEGETATDRRIGDLDEFAVDLAGFLTALHRIDATDGPAAGPQNYFRGGSLTVYDDQTREALRLLDGRIDTKTARALWEEALATQWTHAPVWVHGDIAWGNLLVKDGKLSAVIDFGSSAVGDPACDLAIAWTLFHNGSRLAFRRALPLDTGTWARGRAWTLWKAMITVSGQISRSAEEIRLSEQVIDAVLADHRAGS